MVNPFEAAQEVLERIAEVLEMTPLGGDFFPDLENPFREMPLVGAITGAINNQLAPLNTTGIAGTTGYVGAQNLIPLDSRYRTAFPQDFSGQAIATEQTNKRRTPPTKNIIPT